MWPFQDDEPAWVKARDERYRMIQELILENTPDIVKMPVGYYFVYEIPARTKCRHTEMEYIFDNDKHYCMLEYTQHRLMVSWKNGKSNFLSNSQDFSNSCGQIFHTNYDGQNMNDMRKRSGAVVRLIHPLA